MSSTVIIIPTFNERDNVTPMCQRIMAQHLDADLIFIDDNSPDGTGQLLDELATQYERLSIIHRSGKLGIGSAHLDAIAYAYDHDYDTLVTMDCDFTHSPESIPAMLAADPSAAITVGSRYMEVDSLPGWSILRRFLTRLGHLLTKHLLGIEHDATGAFRVYRLRRIPRALFALVRSRGYSFFFESLFLLNQNHFSIKEVPIVLPARTAGHSKMSMREIVRSVKQLFNLCLAKLVNPSQFKLPAEAINTNSGSA